MNRSLLLNDRRRALAALAFSAVAVAAHGQSARSLSAGARLNSPQLRAVGPAANGLEGGLNLNNFLGANTFYSNGYTGTNIIAANIEGALSRTDHEMTSKIAKTFVGLGAVSGASAQFFHATFCSSLIAGYVPANEGTGTERTRGMAYNATLWSGNIAKSINASNGSFGTDANSLFTAYYNSLIGGLGGQTAHLVSSSWGFTGGTTNAQASISSGYTDEALSIDSIVTVSNKLIVFAAGNNGNSSTSGLRTVGGAGAGNNAFVVGASGPNNPNNPNAGFTGRAGFSAFGASAYAAATGLLTTNIQNGGTINRARVDILAPGQSNVGATNGATNAYASGDGTSFATPIVAGGAALVENAGTALGYSNITDNRVIIAILQNSADKLAGWTNATTNVGGVMTTTQALDFGQGAGQMNLTRAYEQLTAGEHDVAGTAGGNVKAKGWDLGALSVGGANDYNMSLLGGTTFTSTLRFNAGATYGTLGANNSVDANQIGYQYLSNFSLQLYQLVGTNATLVAQSNAAYITSEHFQFNLLTTGNYRLRVNYVSDNYSFVNHGAIGYGLAWNGTAAPVPEPASLVALGLGAAAFVRRRRKA